MKSVKSRLYIYCEEQEEHEEQNEAQRGGGAVVEWCGS